MAGNKDFIEIVREIRGSAAPGETATDGIWYELTTADTDGNPGIYGDILAKYGIFSDNEDAINFVTSYTDELQAIINLEVTLTSLYTDKSKLDSLYNDKDTLDSLYNDKLILDSLYSDKSVLDSIFADKSKLDSLYSDKSKLDSLFADKDNLDTVHDAIGNINIVANNDANVATVGNNINSITTIANNMGDVEYFADRYQGPKGSAPALRNDGSALQAGDLYMNTTFDIMYAYAYAGSTWNSIGSTVNGIDKSESFVATAGQTVFTITDGYDVGYISVFVEGILLGPTEYTATNGSTVTLNVARSAGDVVYVQAYGTFVLADVYSKLESDAITGSLSTAITDLDNSTYSSSETDALLNGKSDTSHTHILQDATNLTISTSAPSGGVDGDIWFEREA